MAAFWGAELKPNKPYSIGSATHRGRLRITKATLGLGSYGNKCSIQCNVPDRTPVLLCSLFPNKLESCSLNLEFDIEDEDVTLSITSCTNSTSVHLTGYFVFRRSVVDLLRDADNDSEPYGEDIGESDGSMEDDDSYEDDSFIDDRDPSALPTYSSPSKGMETSDHELDLFVISQRKRLKKKYQASPIMAGGRSIFSSESEDADEVMAGKRKVRHLDFDESESEVDKKKKKKEKKEETLSSSDIRGKAVETVDKARKKIAIENWASSDNRNVDEDGKTKKIKIEDEIEASKNRNVDEEEGKQRMKKKKKNNNEIEEVASSKNSNEVEEDGIERKKTKKKKNCFLC